MATPIATPIATKLLLIAASGAVGTLARFGLSGLVQASYKGGMPLGTFVVNMIGCLLFGFVWTLSEEKLAISSEARIIILVGFMGAFTTFSTFAFETATLIRDSQWLMAAGNILAQNIIGIAFLFIGIALGRLL